MQVTHDVEMAEERVTERRRDSRRRVLENALIVFSNGHCSIGCQIIDVSDTGAQLVPADIMLCPKEFVLKPQDRKAARHRRAAGTPCHHRRGD